MFALNAIVVILLSFCLRYGSAIHCYDCSSMNNSMCLDPSIYDEETLRKFMPPTNCGHGVYSADHHGFFCRKIVQSILHKGYEAEVRVTRGCGWIRHHRDCYKADNEDHLETVCQCFSDGCNAGTNVKCSLLAAVAAISILGFKFIL